MKNKEIEDVITKIGEFISECGFDSDDEEEIKGDITLLEEYIISLENK